ncbi:hypothetical protein AB0L13_02760 [Saccharopolyspora shandongensis]
MRRLIKIAALIATLVLFIGFAIAAWPGGRRTRKERRSVRIGD